MIEFRSATLPELDLVLDWAAAEGWNPGLDDAAAFLAADPRGFFLALDGDVPVGAISVVNHNPTFAFLGLYLVVPSHRGKGVGYALWSHALEHAGDRTIGLDGVPEQQENYAASGFVHAGKTVRYAGVVGGQAHSEMQPATPTDIGNLIEHEAMVSGARKPDYLRAWFTDTENRKTLVHPKGFLTVRKCRDGAKIGPFVAEDLASATDMLVQASAIFGGTIMIDVPVQSEALAKHCRDLSLAPVFETARMYKGCAPETEPGIFAVASLELG